MPGKILFTCGREPEYPRNALVRAALEQRYELIEVADRHPRLVWRTLRLLAKLAAAPLRKADLLYTGFLGQPLAIWVGWFTRKPILLDAFLSLYDTLCFDRGLFAPQSLPGRLTFWLDQASCRRADQIFVDTQAHARYFRDTFGIPLEKMQRLFVGADERLFYPRSSERTTPLVLFYGNFIPLQGIDVIVRAAGLLAPHNLPFRIIGRGPDWERVQAVVQEVKPPNLEFLPPVPLAALPDLISQATVCLGGHFGASEKAGRVIAGKTFQCLAMGKATIVGDNPANAELMTHNQDAWFCQMNDPQALAEAILSLSGDGALRRRLGEAARQTFMQRASLAALAPQIIELVERMLVAQNR